jgi:hypothetical protein
VRRRKDDDPVTDLLLYYAYAYLTLVVGLFIGAAIYCYRVTRITGGFRAWLFLIAAMSLVALSVVTDFIQIIFFDSVAQVDAIIHQVSLESFLLTSAYTLALGSLFFLAMFELFRTFRKHMVSEG